MAKSAVKRGWLMTLLRPLQPSRCLSRQCCIHQPEAPSKSMRTNGSSEKRKNQHDDSANLSQMIQ